jgi:predicted  nucleic acid-binding Zn-ribbon protein
MGYPEGALLAKSYVIHLDKLIMIENNIHKLESRRNNAFKELENYRSAKSKKRNAIEDFEVKMAGGKK